MLLKRNDSIPFDERMKQLEKDNFDYVTIKRGTYDET